MFYDGDDVWCVSPSGALGVVCMDSAALECCNCLFDEPGFVEGVCVDQALNVVFLADVEAGIDCGGGGAPVFVELKADNAGFNLRAERDGGAVVAFAGDANVDGKGVAGLQHLAYVVCAGGAGGCVCPCAAGLGVSN